MSTSSVTYPAPLITAADLENHVMHFLLAHPEGVSNAEVGRAIGYNDTRQWFSFGVLERLISSGRVAKRPVHGRNLYFIAGP